MRIYENYETIFNTGGGNVGLFGGGLIASIIAFFMTFMIVMLIVAIIMIIANWKIYEKAGKPGWASIVPVYAQIVLLEICELPTWKVILFFIPIANIYIIFIANIELAKKFGKSTGYGIAMVFFGVVLLPMLAFGKAQYQSYDINNNNNYQQPTQQQVPVQPQSMEATNADFCTQCGDQLAPDSTFCTNCGKQL